MSLTAAPWASLAKLSDTYNHDSCQEETAQAETLHPADLPTHASLPKMLISDNYFCQSATTMIAGFA